MVKSGPKKRETVIHSSSTETQVRDVDIVLLSPDLRRLRGRTRGRGPRNRSVPNDSETRIDRGEERRVVGGRWDESEEVEVDGETSV